MHADDFSCSWYEYVGTSFMVLLFIQTIFPIINVLIEVAIKAATRLLIWFKKEATQVRATEGYRQGALQLCECQLAKSGIALLTNCDEGMTGAEA